VKILLLEPYCGGSHQAWAEGYAAHSGHEVKLLSLSARFWKWRMQGGALTLAERARKSHFRPDVILTSDMLNLPAFLGLTRDFLAHVPVAIYFHENQLTYPFPPDEKRDLTYGMINWLSMLTADRVFFNSNYHMDDWFDELPHLLKHFPDYAHVHRVAGVRAKAQVLPVGSDLHRFDPVPDPATNTPALDMPPLIVWNQRWEYDKDPQMFLRALRMLAAEGVDFRVALAGQSYHQESPEFEAARRQLGARVVHFGYADEERYIELLRQADVVVSTAIHEFFGIAIVEAIYCGCFPLLPRRLSYLEIVKPIYHTACLYDGFASLLERLRLILTEPGRPRALASKLRHTVMRFDWSNVATRYDEALQNLKSKT
jgi:glycosyltransferase involved in cell wall biosynthesis